MTCKCPHCKKRVHVNENAVWGCETYGDQNYKVVCPKCKGPIHVHLYRTVVLDGVAEGAFETDDWGNASSLAPPPVPKHESKKHCPTCKCKQSEVF